MAGGGYDVIDRGRSSPASCAREKAPAPPEDAARPRHVPVPATATATRAAIAAAAPATSARPHRLGVLGAVERTDESVLASASLSSLPDAYRSAGAFARQVFTSVFSQTGNPGFSRARSIGWSRAIAIAMSIPDSPLNGRSPASISKRTIPKLNTSLRTSTARPCACSGDMYAGVPSTWPSSVSTAAVD